jgi:hypothetical protein
LTDLALNTTWSAPRTVNNELAELSAKMSNKIAWSAAADLLGPFLSKILGIDSSLVSAGLSGASQETDGVRVAIGRTRSTMVNPLAIARSLGEKSHRLPANIESDFGRETGRALYVIDCVFASRELTLELVGSNANDAAANLEAKLVGKVETSQLLCSNSTLTITGNNRTPFAFTCLRIQSNLEGYIDRVMLGEELPRLNATPMDSIANVAHVGLGESDELLAFDD